MSVQCLEDSEYLILPYSALEDAYEESINISNLGRLMTERGFMDYLRLTTQKKNSPQETYEIFEIENKDIIDRIPLKVLASFIGITPESLSRIRKRRVLQ